MIVRELYDRIDRLLNIIPRSEADRWIGVQDEAWDYIYVMTAWEIYRANLAKERPTMERVFGQIRANYETERALAISKNRRQNMRNKWERGTLNELLSIIARRNEAE